jgi:RimJ/RimL family protein N-acetyltransferase
MANLGAVVAGSSPFSALGKGKHAHTMIDTVFSTERLAIKLAKAKDADLYHALWTNSKVMVNVGFPQGLHITRRQIEVQLQKQKGSEFGRLLVAVLKITGQAIGECKMHLPDDDGISTTDIKLLPEFWGNRFGVEIKQGLLQHLFTYTDCRAVQATPNIENVPSIKMQEAVGGVRVGEGVAEFPDHMREYTRPVHHYIYRVDRRDWQRARDQALQ